MVTGGAKRVTRRRGEKSTS